jgi:hypothetical protein
MVIIEIGKEIAKPLVLTSIQGRPLRRLELGKQNTEYCTRTIVGIICTADRETWACVQARTRPSLYPVLEGISGWRRKELFGEEQEEGRGVEMKGCGSKGYELFREKKQVLGSGRISPPRVIPPGCVDI